MGNLCESGGFGCAINGFMYDTTMVINIIVIISIIPIFLVLLITVKIIAIKIRFTASAKDEMTTKE